MSRGRQFVVSLVVRERSNCRVELLELRLRTRPSSSFDDDLIFSERCWDAIHHHSKRRVRFQFYVSAGRDKTWRRNVVSCVHLGPVKEEALWRWESLRCKFALKLLCREKASRYRESFSLKRFVRVSIGGLGSGHFTMPLHFAFLVSRLERRIRVTKSWMSRVGGSGSVIDFVAMPAKRASVPKTNRSREDFNCVKSCECHAMEFNLSE